MEHLLKSSSRTTGWMFAGLILMAWALVACLHEPDDRAVLVVPTPQPSIPATFTVQTAVPTPPPIAPTATLIAPTVVISPSAALVCQYDFFFSPAPDSCPAGPSRNSAAAEQPFEGGLMIWLEASDSVLVFYEDGRWQRFDDTWSEDQPESDPAIIAPFERFQPIRGFGKVWREHPQVRDALGWALGVELGFDSTIQDLLHSPGLPEQTFLRTYNGQVFVLAERAAGQGDWALAADNR